MIKQRPLLPLILGAVLLWPTSSAVAQGSGATGSPNFPGNQAQNLEVTTWGDVIAITWQEQTSEGELQNWYRLSIDGGQTFGRDRQTSYDILLRYAQFDPLYGEPEVISDLQARSDHELFVVQYITQGTEEWRETIRDLGGVDHRFLANHANIWRMDHETAATIRELPFVRWVGEFHPAYKLENELLEAYYTGSLETRSYRLVVGEWGPGEKATLVRNMETLGGFIEANIDEGWVVEAYLTPSQLFELIHTHEVLGVDRKGVPEEDMNNVRNLMGGNYLHGLGFDGTGVRAEVMDGGLDTGRSEWKYAPILHGPTSGSTSHGTSTYSINFSNGSASTTRGWAPDAQGIFADYGSYGGNRYAHTAELLTPAYEAVYQSNSWGSSRTTTYTSISQEMDDIIFINDFVITQSQSNAGNQDSRPQAWAKNIVAVGGIRHYNNTNNNDDDWSFGASTGPAADGRVKPDLSAFYDSVNTVNNSSFGGTSAASPIVAGAFALTFEMWHNGVFNNPTSTSVFDSRPHSTLARALMINSAWQWPWNQNDITRFRQGWGRPDLEYMYDNRDAMLWVNESDVLSNLQSKTYNVTVNAGTGEFRATMVYLDRAGTTSSGQHRINDLSMQVTAPNGTQYWGNNGLTAGNYNVSSSGGSSNTIDVVENVIIQNPAVGDWTIEIFADEINQDTHTETGALDADFALVVTGVEVAPCGDSINITGPATASVGGIVTMNYSNATGSASFEFLYSLNNNGTVINGQCFNVGIPFFSAGGGTTTASGTGSWTSGVIPPKGAGKTVYIEMKVDSGGTTTDSNVHVLDIF